MLDTPMAEKGALNDYEKQNGSPITYVIKT